MSSGCGLDTDVPRHKRTYSALHEVQHDPVLVVSLMKADTKCTYMLLKISGATIEIQAMVQVSRAANIEALVAPETGLVLG
jgi:hypothetical protein